MGMMTTTMSYKRPLKKPPPPDPNRSGLPEPKGKGKAKVAMPEEEEPTDQSVIESSQEEEIPINESKVNTDFKMKQNTSSHGKATTNKKMNQPRQS